MLKPDQDGITRLIVIDDNAAIHEDIRKILGRRDSASPSLGETEALLFGEAAPRPKRALFEIDSALQGKDGFEMVKEALGEGRPYSVAFVDVRMPPGWDGVETISHIWELDRQLQIVMCTAYSDYSWDEIESRIGQTDNLVILKKPFDNIEVLQLAHALSTKWHLARHANLRLGALDELVRQRTTQLQLANDRLTTEVDHRMSTEAALRLSEEQFAKAFHANPLAMGIITLHDRRYVNVNESLLALTELKTEDLLNSTADEIGLLVDPDDYNLMLTQLPELKSIRNRPVRVRTSAGAQRDVLVFAEGFELGIQPHALVIWQDITDQLVLEARLRQAQKMEAVGQLAAGIAHDFNKSLTVIQGYASLALSHPNLGQPLMEAQEAILAASNRASNLTRQLLAFSRRQMIQPQVLNLNTVVTQCGSMLHRLIGEHVQLRLQFEETVPPVLADSSCLEMVLVNLAVNARDAMPSGGELVIRTRRVVLDAAAVATKPEARTGEFVAVSVRDTGNGMSEDVMARAFDPFFTTKEVGKGTGLGLATVYGIVKQHGGWIEVESRPGKGSNFTFFLPSVDASESPPEPVSEGSTPSSARGEVIIVVEDEPEVRRLACRLLRKQGYTVLEAANGHEAIRLWQGSSEQVDLVITDMIMPEGMSGRELARILQARQPGLKVIYTSGYAADLTGIDPTFEDYRFIQKPYQAAAFLQTVRDYLDTESAGQRT